MHLGSRMSSALVLLKALNLEKGNDPDKLPMILQLDQEVDRARIGIGFCPCLTPSGVYYFGSKGKLLTGQDFAALQGVTRADLAQYGMDKVDDYILRDLFGNSFSATICTFAVLAALRDLAG
jgi:hypothetical protein